MGQFEHEYKGYNIMYNEGEAQWFCPALGLKHIALKTLKDNITKWEAQSRKLNGVPVLITRHSYYDRNEGSYTPAKATSFDADGQVWTVTDRKTRGKYSIDRLSNDTPQNREILDRIKSNHRAAENAVSTAYKERQAMFKMLTPITKEELLDLGQNDIDNPLQEIEYEICCPCKTQRSQ